MAFARASDSRAVGSSRANLTPWIVFAPASMAASRTTPTWSSTRTLTVTVLFTR